MKFKLDENFGKRTQHLFKIAGHDVQTTKGYPGCPSRTNCGLLKPPAFASINRIRKVAEQREIAAEFLAKLCYAVHSVARGDEAVAYLGRVQSYRFNPRL